MYKPLQKYTTDVWYAQFHFLMLISTALQTLSKGFEKESRLVRGKNRASLLCAFHAPETFYQVGGDIVKVDKSTVKAVSIALASLVNQFVSFRFQRIAQAKCVFLLLALTTAPVSTYGTSTS